MAARRKPEEFSDRERYLIERAYDLHYNKGLSWITVAYQLGTSTSWLRWRLDKGYRGIRVRTRNRKKDYQGVNHNVGKATMTKEELAARQALIPDDTRDFTARWFGDPIRPDPRRPGF